MSGIYDSVKYVYLVFKNGSRIHKGVPVNSGGLNGIKINGLKR